MPIVACRARPQASLRNWLAGARGTIGTGRCFNRQVSLVQVQNKQRNVSRTSGCNKDHQYLLPTLSLFPPSLLLISFLLYHHLFMAEKIISSLPFPLVAIPRTIFLIFQIITVWSLFPRWTSLNRFVIPGDEYLRYIHVHTGCQFKWIMSELRVLDVVFDVTVCACLSTLHAGHIVRLSLSVVKY